VHNAKCVEANRRELLYGVGSQNNVETDIERLIDVWRSMSLSLVLLETDCSSSNRISRLYFYRTSACEAIQSAWYCSIRQSVRLLNCLSHAGRLSKWLNLSSKFFHHANAIDERCVEIWRVTEPLARMFMMIVSTKFMAQSATRPGTVVSFLSRWLQYTCVGRHSTLLSCLSLLQYSKWTCQANCLVLLHHVTTAAQYLATGTDRCLPVTSRHFCPQPAWLLQQCAGWATCHLDAASSVGSKRCSTADFRRSAPITEFYLSVFTGLSLLSASSSQSLCSPTEQWMTVLWCTCRPTSPESLTCHLDWDADHPHPTNWLFHLATSLLSAGGPFQSPPPISGTVSLHISHQHSRSRFSGSVLRLFSSCALQCSYPDLIIWHSKFTLRCGPCGNFVICTTLKFTIMMMMIIATK